MNSSTIILGGSILIAWIFIAVLSIALLADLVKKFLDMKAQRKWELFFGAAGIAVFMVVGKFLVEPGLNHWRAYNDRRDDQHLAELNACYVDTQCQLNSSEPTEMNQIRSKGRAR